MTAEVICVGTELCLGLTQDTNGPYVARRLAEMGHETTAISVVPDEVAAIADVLSRAIGRSDLVVLTGGLGPTADDVTRDAIAAATRRPFETNAESLSRLESFFRKRGTRPSASNLRQAELPVGAFVLANTCGTADGFAVSVDGCLVAALPGVPVEMRAMFGALAELVGTRLPGRQSCLRTRILRTFGLPESVVDERLAHLLERGRTPQVGLSVSRGTVSVRITAEAPNPRQAERMLDAADEQIRDLLGDAVFGRDEATLEQVVAGLLIDSGLTIAVAESCTGGLIADMLTDTSGISASLLAAYICYADRAKTDVLGVPRDLITRHGAVSAEVARAMALAAAQCAGSDLAVATTGIAGPTGGTRTKPVGLVYTALADSGRVKVERHVFAPPRRAVKERAARVALNMVRLRIIKGRTRSAAVAR